MTYPFGGFKNPFAEFRENPRGAIAKRLKIVVGLSGLLSISGYLGDLNRILEITSHFKVYYLFASLIALLVLAVLKECRWAGFSLLVFLLSFAEVAPWYIGHARSETPQSSQVHRLALINVLTSNNRYSDLIDQLKELDPDILVLQEVDKVWSKELEPLREGFPHRKGITRSDNFGILFFSKYPLENPRIEYFKARAVPFIRSLIVFPDFNVEFLAVHTLPPANAETFRVRDRQLEEVAGIVSSSTYPIIVAGDLNISMWSPSYKRFESEARFTNARKGFGIQPTWPAVYAPFMVPIDHVLYSEKIRIVDCWTGEPFGSDHLPLFVDFELSQD